MKTCSVCLEQKPLASFYTNGRQPGTGKQKYKPSCRSCEQQAHHQKVLDMVKEMFGKVACQKCGYDKCFAALHFHHRNPSEKEGTVSKLIKGSLKKLRAEIEKCDLLCANCHAEHHYEERLSG